MRPKKAIAIFVFVILALLCCADIQAKENFKVFVGVAGAENMTRQVRSYVERELRSLPDVTIVNDASSPDKDYDILISCAANEKDSRYVYIAVMFTKNLAAVYNEISAEIKSPASQEFITGFLANISAVPVSFPQSFAGTERDLEVMSKDIVKTFDSMVLAAHRKILEQYGAGLDPRNLLAGLWAAWTE